MLVTRDPATNRYFIKRWRHDLGHYIPLIEMSEGEAKCVAHQIYVLLDHNKAPATPAQRRIV